MTTLTRVKKFRFWCQKVIPLVYDDSLSYYEVLCKCVDYINNLIETDNEIFATIDDMQNDIKILQEWVDNFDSEAEKTIRELIEKYIAGSVIFGLTNDGYFCAYIPDSWSKIHFGTIMDFPDPLYGHLTLSYD